MVRRFLPLLVPIGHFHLAARQADDRRGMSGGGEGDGQVLQESVKALGHAAMAVDEVEDLVEQQQHGSIGGGEHLVQSLGSRRRGRGGGAKGQRRPVRRPVGGPDQSKGFRAQGRGPRALPTKTPTRAAGAAVIPASFKRPATPGKPELSAPAVARW